MASKDPVFDVIKHELVTHRGIFIGESHDSNMAVDFLIAHLRQLKALGVTTIYVEYDMYGVNARQRGQACLDQRYFGNDNAPAAEKAAYHDRMNRFNTFRLVLEAKAAGLRVIGHDDVVKDAETYPRFANETLYKGSLSVDPTLGPVSYRSAVATTPEAMDRRNDFAGRLIEATRDGEKFIVFGGTRHSGARPSDLDQSLGIPSIDFVVSEETTRARRQTSGQLIDKGMKAGDAVYAAAAAHPIPKHIAPNIAPDSSGGSTYKVVDYSGYPDRFTFDVTSSPAKTTWGRKALNQATKAPGILGEQCALPKALQHREILGDTDIENLAKFLKKPEGAAAKRMP